MRTESESPPPKTILLCLQQNEGHVAAVNHQKTTVTRTTIHQVADEVIGMSLALLGGNGHFRYGPLACKTFLRASECNKHFKKITTGESVTSSVSCAKKYFEDKCTGLKQDEFFWYNAARYGRLEVMEWARLQGYSVAWKIGWFYIGPKTCAKAAEYGQLQALQWLKENDCPWDNHTCQAADTCQAAARNGHLSCLQWARENGCEWDKNTCSAAAGNGHISCLQWARENGCEWDKITCSAAAGNGHISCLKWARENGCDWDEYTCAAAAKHGHLSCLQWARENGCPWDGFTMHAATHAATRNGHLSCLQWARENGCPEYDSESEGDDSEDEGEYYE